MGTVYKRGRIWWFAYYRNGKQFFESSESADHDYARDLLKQREGDISRGLQVVPKMSRIRFGELARDLVADYSTNKRKSLYDLRIRLNEHLLPTFEYRRVALITTAEIRDYIKARQAEGAANASINRELSAMKRAFRLAVQGRKLLSPPYVPMLREDNVRQGFFEPAELAAVIEQLPAALRPMIEFAAITGWRIGNVKRLEWSQVSDTVVRLEPGTTKNSKGVEFPVVAVKGILDGQRAEMKRLGLITPRVFHRNGKPIRSFKKAWAKACADAKISRHVHDLRRTAVRNLIRNGVSERVAMQLTGHKTRSVFDRYAIVSQQDIVDAGAKIEAAMTIAMTKAGKSESGG